MGWDERQKLIRAVEEARKGRTLLCLFNFDRANDNPNLGLLTMFGSDVKEALFRVLKESPTSKGIDLCLYTRGGDTNAVWPIVSLLREFDPDFEVLVPFRCHSAGTLLALGAKRIVLGPLSELSPIDPSTGNQFNPQDASGKYLGISVEDVQAYQEFVRTNLAATDPATIEPFLAKLVDRVHPLALGNVDRVHKLSKRLAGELLSLRSDHAAKDKVVKALSSEFQSHLHMINRHEAKKMLGPQVEHANAKLSSAVDALLRGYEDDFQLRRPFIVRGHLKDETTSDVVFVGAAAESRHWSYLFKTRGHLHQFSVLPPGVQVQIPPGQGMPLVPGLPREHRFEVVSQGWEHNTARRGVTT